jgi:competence protein ComEA
VALLSSAASLSPAREPEPCTTPVESAAQGGWTTRVGCHGVGDPDALRGPARLLFGLQLDANAASAAALETLPGLGPALAGRVVEARAAGAFCTAEDLERVRGIGPVLRARIAPGLAFTGAGCPSGQSAEGV